VNENRIRSKKIFKNKIKTRTKIISRTKINLKPAITYHLLKC